MSDDLIRRYLDGVLDPAGEEQLRTLLAQKPARARRLFDLAAERSLLVDALRAIEAPVRRAETGSRRLALAAAVAATLLLAWAAFNPAPAPRFDLAPGERRTIDTAGLSASLEGYARVQVLRPRDLRIDAGAAELDGPESRLETPHWTGTLAGRCRVEVREESTRIVAGPGGLRTGSGEPIAEGDGIVADARGARTVDRLAGLIAWWPMDDARDGRVPDHGGLGLSASLEGGVSLRDGALEFDGPGPAWAGVPHAQAIDFGRPDAAFTWIAWIRTTRGGDLLGKPRRDVALSDSIPGYLHLSPRGRLHFYRWVEGEGRLQTTVSDAPGLLDGAWHQVAVVQDGPALRRLYVDGILVHEDRDPWPQDTRSGSPFSLGYCHNLGLRGSAQYRGSLDEARLYGRALSGAEIDSLFRRVRAGR